MDATWQRELPPPGEVFTVHYRGEPLTVMVVEVPCECRAHPEPHTHLQIPLPGLHRGARAVLTRQAEREWRLELAPTQPA